MEKLDILREAHVPPEQAEAIVRIYEASDYVTKDYLDARLEKAVTDLTWRVLGIVGIAIVIVGIIDKYVRP